MNLERLTYPALERILWPVAHRGGTLLDVDLVQSSPPELAHRLRLQNAHAFAVRDGAECVALVALASTRGNRNQGVLGVLPVREGVDLEDVSRIATSEFAVQFGMTSFLVTVPARRPDLERAWTEVGFARVAIIPTGEFRDGRSSPVHLLYRGTVAA